MDLLERHNTCGVFHHVFRIETNIHRIRDAQEVTAGSSGTSVCRLPSLPEGRGLQNIRTNGQKVWTSFRVCPDICLIQTFNSKTNMKSSLI